jgi:heat shock protein HslJ
MTRLVHPLAAPAACAALVLVLVLGLHGCGRPPETARDPDSTASVLDEPPVPPAVDSTLMAGAWHWMRTVGAATPLAPTDPAKYTLAFEPDGTALVRADCNQGSGPYRLVEGNRIETGPFVLTLMGCAEGSLDRPYLQGLQAAEGYAVSGDTLSLTLELNGGMMQFVRRPRGG